jgi:uncharacterized SAM-binding protein YcdF (DUF218 family)
VNVDRLIALSNLVVTTVACSATVTGVLHQLRKPPKNNGPSSHKAKVRSLIDRLLPRRLVIVGMITIIAGFILLLYQIWLSGSVNRWFVRIHTGLGYVTAIAGVLLIAGMVIVLWRRPKRRTRGWLASIIYLLALIFLGSFVTFGCKLVYWETIYPSARLVSAGFELFDREDYSAAIGVSGECVEDFGGAAIDLERKVAAKQYPKGRVPDSVKAEIFENGVLNDVGGCSWVAARSMQKLGHTDEAKTAYDKVLAFPHARVWDEMGFFWSPAEDAQDRLKDL